jgi:hypothetical protein
MPPLAIFSLGPRSGEVPRLRPAITGLARATVFLTLRRDASTNAESRAYVAKAIGSCARP